MPPRRSVIFDLDGVLVDSAGAHRRAWQQLGDEIGVPFTGELFGHTFGQRNESIIPTWLGEVSPQRIAELGARKEVLYRRLVRGGAVRVYRRVRELLAELRDAGFVLGAASSGPRQNVDLIIDVIGGASLIRASVAAEDVAEGKPHPEAFLTAAKRLGTAPEMCMVIEDSTHGIEAAKRAGMIAVGVLTSTAREKLSAAGADLLVGEVGDLDTGALGRLLRG